MGDGLERIFNLVETSFWGEDGRLGMLSAWSMGRLELDGAHPGIVSSRHDGDSRDYLLDLLVEEMRRRGLRTSISSIVLCGVVLRGLSFDSHSPLF